MDERDFAELAELEISSSSGPPPFSRRLLTNVSCALGRTTKLTITPRRETLSGKTITKSISVGRGEVSCGSTILHWLRRYFCLSPGGPPETDITPRVERRGGPARCGELPFKRDFCMARLPPPHSLPACHTW